MSQHDYNIANAGGAAVRSDINNALLAILSQNSGATAPTTTKPFMPWFDTASGILKIRSSDDTAWLDYKNTSGQLVAPTFTGLITALGGQIKFPATQNPSADANTLDDYEEGTWTPTGIGVTFASASGKYTKIGRVVHISFDITWPTNGAGNQAGINGFPFASNGSVFAYTRGTSTYSSSIVMASPGYAGTNSGLLLYNFGNPGISDSAMSGATLSGSGFYFTS